jgi:hypothetical protein
MKNILFLSMFLFAATASAYDYTLSTQTAMAVSSNEAALKLEDSLMETEGILKRFTPPGVQVLKKSVNGNAFEFLVVKSLLGMSQTIDLKGTLVFERVASGCQGTEQAYLGTVDFTGSQQNVEDSIESFKLLLCSSEKSAKSLNVRVKSTLYYNGKKFNFIVEKFAKNLIEEQVEAILLAVKGDVAARK